MIREPNKYNEIALADIGIKDTEGYDSIVVEQIIDGMNCVRVSIRLKDKPQRYKIYINKETDEIVKRI